MLVDKLVDVLKEISRRKIRKKTILSSEGHKISEKIYAVSKVFMKFYQNADMNLMSELETKRDEIKKEISNLKANQNELELIVMMGFLIELFQDLVGCRLRLDTPMSYIIK